MTIKLSLNKHNGHNCLIFIKNKLISRGQRCKFLDIKKIVLNSSLKFELFFFQKNHNNFSILVTIWPQNSEKVNLTDHHHRETFHKTK